MTEGRLKESDSRRINAQNWKIAYPGREDELKVGGSMEIYEWMTNNDEQRLNLMEYAIMLTCVSQNVANLSTSIAGVTRSLLTTMEDL